MLRIIRRIGFALLLSHVSVACGAETSARSEDLQPVRDVRTVVLENGRAVQLEGLFNVRTGAPVEVAGGFENERLLSRSDDALLRFIDDHPASFGVESRDLKIIGSADIHGKRYFTAEQKVDGRPVLGTRVIVRAGSSGKIIAWGSDVVKAEGLKWKSTISKDEAVIKLQSTMNAQGAATVEVSEFWYRNGADIAPAYQVRLLEPNKCRLPRGLIDANTGAVIQSDDGIWDATISGTFSGPVIPRNPATPVETRALAKVKVKLAQTTVETSTDEDGRFEIADVADGEHNVEFSCENANFIVENYQLDLMHDPSQANNPFHFDTVYNAPADGPFVIGTDVAADDRTGINVFYHLGLVHSWWYQRDRTVGILDDQVRVFPGQTDAFFSDNAGFMPATPGMIDFPLIMFGVGGTGHSNFAHFAEIMYHEFNHGVTASFYPNDQDPPAMLQAMHEAFSDYFACAITGTPRVGLGFFTEYPDSCIRSLINDFVYPADWQGEGHHDSQMLSAAMWETRLALGAEYADSVLHFARYGGPTDFESYLDEVLIADDDNDNLTDGTPHEVEIRTAFSRHGIGEPPDTTTGASDPQTAVNIPLNPRLVRLYPNPFNPTVTVEFELPRASGVTLEVFDVLGREVQRLSYEHATAGQHSQQFNLAGASDGVYFIRMSSPGFSQTAKALLLK
jgi:hypothetical protein